MSGGLYSTEGRDFDQTLDLKKIKPYGDTMNDGKTQLSFTLPVPAGDEAIEAAKQLMKKMGFENPQVVFHQELTKGYTFFNCYGNCVHTVDYSNIYVPKVESTKWDMGETDQFVREHIFPSTLLLIYFIQFILFPLFTDSLNQDMLCNIS